MKLLQEPVLKRAAMLALKALGGACWAAAYRQAIAETNRSGKPLLAPMFIAFNLVWEGIYSSGGIIKWRSLTIEDRVQTVINLVWLFLDVIWSKALSRHDIRITRTSILIAVIYNITFLSRYTPDKAARISALWQNLAFSSYAALEDQNFKSDFYNRFTLYRTLGTAIPTLTSGALRGIRPQYLVPGVGCIVFDVIRFIRSKSSI